VITDNVAILLAVLVVANVVLATVAIWRNRSERRRVARRDATATVLATSTVDLPSAGPRPAGIEADAAAVVPAPRTDALTDALLPGEWNRLLRDEDARIYRYGRPATIVLIELEGLDSLVAALGQPAGDRVVVAVAETMKRHARSADQIARLGPGRFGLLLPETGEVEAINLIERLRALCDLWLQSGAIALQLAIGWASPASEMSLDATYAEAQERMHAELRRIGRTAIRPDAGEAAASSAMEGAASPA
jgi:diguanylate cyclase (GGDEF)-like protein